MIKKGPLSNKDKDFIKANIEDGASKLAKKLNRAEGTVAKFVESLPAKKASNARGFEMFGRNEKGSTVMTQSASELGDDYRSRVTLSTKTKNCITSVRKND
jgi:hypothetical protein